MERHCVSRRRGNRLKHRAPRKQGTESKEEKEEENAINNKVSTRCEKTTKFDEYKIATPGTILAP
jgi:hypothetical protein